LSVDVPGKYFHKEKGKLNQTDIHGDNSDFDLSLRKINENIDKQDLKDKSVIEDSKS